MGAIVMFDVTSRQSFQSIPDWYDEVKRFCPGIPLVICGNKVDREDRTVQPNRIHFHRKKNVPYFEISVQAGYNYDKPFLHLARILTGNVGLSFLRSGALPPSRVINSSRQATYE